MNAIISAACTFPSGPVLILADVAHRLQFSLIRKHPLHQDQCGFPIKACYFPELIHVTPVERFRLLLGQVLKALLENMPELKQSQPGQVGLLLPPLSRPGISSELTTTAWKIIAEFTGWRECPFHVRHGDRAETISLLNKMKAHALPENAFSVLLAADSWLLPSSLKWLEAENLLHSARRPHGDISRENPYGRVPSEGAAALILAPSHAGVEAWCHIQSATQTEEDVLYSDKGVCRGRGLIQAAQQVLDAATITAVSHIVSDSNGEPYRADELGFTLLALNHNIKEKYERETPVLASGDLGCASLVAHTAMSAWRMHSSDESGDTLLLSTSDNEQRGAILLSKN